MGERREEKTGREGEERRVEEESARTASRALCSAPHEAVVANFGRPKGWRKRRDAGVPLGNRLAAQRADVVGRGDSPSRNEIREGLDFGGHVRAELVRIEVLGGRGSEGIVSSRLGMCAHGISPEDRGIVVRGVTHVR